MGLEIFCLASSRSPAICWKNWKEGISAKLGKSTNAGGFSRLVRLQLCISSQQIVKWLGNVCGLQGKELYAASSSDIFLHFKGQKEGCLSVCHS